MSSFTVLERRCEGKLADSGDTVIDGAGGRSITRCFSSLEGMLSFKRAWKTEFCAQTLGNPFLEPWTEAEVQEAMTNQRIASPNASSSLMRNLAWPSPLCIGRAEKIRNHGSRLTRALEGQKSKRRSTSTATFAFAALSQTTMMQI